MDDLSAMSDPEDVDPLLSRAGNTEGQPVALFDDRSDDPLTLLMEPNVDMISQVEEVDVSDFDDFEPVCPRCRNTGFEYDRECKAHVCDYCGLWLDDAPLDDWTF